MVEYIDIITQLRVVNGAGDLECMYVYIYISLFCCLTLLIMYRNYRIKVKLGIPAKSLIPSDQFCTVECS